MTNKDANVRLVLVGDADAAPVCEGDVCFVPGSTAPRSTVDSSAPPHTDEVAGDESAGEHRHGVA